MKIFIDTNVIIDLLLQRDGYIEAAKIFALFKKEGISLFTSVLSIANIAYILRKKFQGDKLYNELGKISALIAPLDLSRDDYFSTLQLKAKDFEDGLQYSCALSNNCDCIVTRNKKDFSFSTIGIFTPKEFLDSTIF